MNATGEGTEQSGPPVAGEGDDGCACGIGPEDTFGGGSSNDGSGDPFLFPEGVLF